MRETRIFDAPVSVRQASEKVATITGYGAVFDVPYEVMGFTESVAPSAFTKTLQERSDVAVVMAHDETRVLGTKESGTARFEADDHGLRYEADLDLLDPDGLSAHRKIATGKVRQSSFAFRVIKDEWEERSDAPPHRVLQEVELWECSPVLRGANPSTEVDIKRAARSLAKVRDAAVDEVIQALKQQDEPAPKGCDVTGQEATGKPDEEPPEQALEPTSQPDPKPKHYLIGT